MSSTSGGPSGRSPFAGGRRGRPSYDGTAVSTGTSIGGGDQTLSPFGGGGMIPPPHGTSTTGGGGGGLLSQGGRISPAAAAGWTSPHNNAMGGTGPSATGTASNRRGRKFIFDDGSIIKENKSFQQQPSSTKPNVNHDNSKDPTISMNEDDIDNSSSSRQAPQIVDGMNLSQLRMMTKEALGINCSTGTLTTSSPSMAVFYASILYSKTFSLQDALLYAQTLQRNGEYKRCVRLLEKASLLSSIEYVEAILLACQCLSEINEWNELLRIVEDVTIHIEDDEDDISWNTLVDVYNNNNKSSSNRTMIHPFSRLCLWRGMAYDQISNPTRAAIYWKRSLMIDVKCIDSFDLLLRRSVISTKDAYDLIINNLHFNGSSSTDWLKQIYLAKLDNIPTASTNGNNNGNNATNSNLNGEGRETNISSETKKIEQMPITMSKNRDDINRSISLFGGVTDTSSIHHVTTPTNGAASSMMSMIQSPSPTSTGGTNKSKSRMFLDESSNVTALKDEKNDDNRKLPANGKAAGTSINNDNIDVDMALDNLCIKYKLHQSSEILSLAAIRAYRNYNLYDALQYCQAVKEIDPLCPAASYVHVAALVGLKHKRLLFDLAHEWVDASPKSAKSWFAVGSYYYVCERYHVAQRHYCRATRLDPQCTEAWIAFGCSFAMCDESDQALASFRAAQRLAPAQHFSLLYMGMEYLRTNHLVLAQHFLSAALQSSSGSCDPLCLHELGVSSWTKKDYTKAISYFTKALRSSVEASSSSHSSSSSSHNTLLQLSAQEGSSTANNSRQRQGGRNTKNLTIYECIELCRDTFWEPTLFNLGHCYRKTRQFNEAAHCFEKCLALCPGNASSYAALGFTKHLLGDLDGAIEQYHQALSRKPDDHFSSEMLNRALQESLSAISLEDDVLFPSTQHQSRDIDNQDGSILFGTGNNSQSLLSPVSSILSPA